MSASLVRKGLELFSDDVTCSTKKANTFAASANSKTGVKKLKRKQNRDQKARGASLTVKGKKVKSSLERYNKRKAKDNTKDAIKFLNLLSSKKTGNKVVKQMSEYQQRRSVKRTKKQRPQQKPKEPKSCFSDEDFARFEREYFVGPRPR